MKYEMKAGDEMDKAKAFFAETVWAVVGATDKKDRFGYKIYKTMKEGWNVYPVNPRVEEIDGDVCYPDLASLPEKPGVVNLVTNPAVSLDIVRQCKGLGISKVWIQPGAEDSCVIKYCDDNGIEVLSKRCAMAESRHNLPRC